MSKFKVTWLVICLFLVNLLGCSRESPVEKATKDNILLLGNGPEPESLDPHLSTTTPALNIQMSLFEGLVSPDPEKLDPVPAVAESWEISDDGRVYRFKIREEARWSDGEPVTAEDFYVAFKRILNPELAAPYATFFYDIEGAEAFHRGELEDFSQVGIKVSDSGKFVVRLKDPTPYFLQVLMHPAASPMRKSILSDAGALESRSKSWISPESFVGNGPFILKEWRPNVHVEVVPNPHYWDRDQVSLSGIRFHAIDEPGAEERAFLSGQLHVTDALPPTRVAAYKKREEGPLRVDPYLGTYYLLLNTEVPPLEDRRVRQALALSIDRESIVDNLLGAGQRPAQSFVPENMPDYTPPSGEGFNPERARELLAEAGFPGGKGFPELSYLFNTSESHKRIAEAIQSMWREHLGVDINLINQEWRVYLDRRSQGDFDIARAVWIGDYPEPSTFLKLWTSQSSNNWVQWEDSGYDELINKAGSILDRDTRYAHYLEAEKRLLADQPIVPLYHYVTVYLKRPEVQGWYSNLLDWHPYKHVWLDEAGEAP